MIKIEEIRTFVTLVETNSSTKAAEQMSVAISAISRRMKDLEARLGVQLIQRTTRRMTVTESGTRFYQRCRRILEDLEEAEQIVSCSAKELKGNLKIATSMSFGVPHLSPVISAFMHMHKDLTIDLAMSDRTVDLVEEGFDVAVRIGVLQDSSLIARKLSSICHVVCASPEFLKIHGVPQSHTDLAALPGLHYSNIKRSDAWAYTDPAGRSDTIKIPTRMRCSSGDALREAAIAGLGIICEPAFIVYKAIEQGLLQAVLPDYKWYDGMNLYAIYPQTRHLSARVREFIDFLVKHFGEKPYWEKCLKPNGL